VHDLTWGVVVDHARQRHEHLAVQTARVAAEYADRGVVAMGLGGDERYPPAPFANAFAIAREAGLWSVPHAGEVAGPDSIRDALRYLLADRIGHGIRVLEDTSLTAEMAHRGVPLEVCVTSNVATKTVSSIPDHPIRRLINAGLTVTLASDDPAMFGAWLSEDYDQLRRHHDFDDNELATLARNSVAASFAAEQRKSELLSRVDGWIRF
jgi:adenosine deaminase